MYAGIAVTAVVCFAAGVVFGRKYEQKIVAKVLAEFARVDSQAKGLVNRCYTYLSNGLKAELKKVGL
jgi:hypothetical protein